MSELKEQCRFLNNDLASWGIMLYSWRMVDSLTGRFFFSRSYNPIHATRASIISEIVKHHSDTDLSDYQVDIFDKRDGSLAYSGSAEDIYDKYRSTIGGSDVDEEDLDLRQKLSLWKLLGSLR